MHVKKIKHMGKFTKILWSKSSNIPLNCDYLTIEWIQVTKL